MSLAAFALGVLLGALGISLLVRRFLLKNRKDLEKRLEESHKSEGAALLQAQAYQSRHSELRRTLQTYTRRVGRLEEMLSSSASATHDLKNLLTVMGFKLEALFADVSTPSSVARLRALERVLEEACNNCGRLLRPRAPVRAPLPRQSLNELVLKAKPLLEGALELRAGLRMELSEGLPPLALDKDLLTYALLDLVMLASKSMREGPLRLFTHREGSSVLLGIEEPEAGSGPLPDGSELHMARQAVHQCGARLEFFLPSGKSRQFVMAFPA